MTKWPRSMVVLGLALAILWGGGVLSAKSKHKKAPAAPPSAPTAPAAPESSRPAPTPKEEQRQATEASWTVDPTSQMVFYAVLDGLYTDGVDNSAMELIIPVKPNTKKPDYTANFIYTCPLCQPALEAMRTYRARPAFLGFKAPGPDTIGAGIDEGIREQLGSPALSQRQEAMERLVEKWVRQRLDLMRSTDAERADWLAKFEAARTKGLEILKTFQEKKTFGDSYADWNRCPICDGAVKACGGTH